MNNKYAVVLGRGVELPSKELLISEAWGEMPVSFFQDHECFSECAFLDLKVNKWEINGQWSAQQDSEPWIRIELLRGEALKEYLLTADDLPPVDTANEFCIVFELDEGGADVDKTLLLRLVSLFFPFCKVFKLDDGFQELSQDAIADLPSQKTVYERLMKCE